MNNWALYAQEGFNCETCFVELYQLPRRGSVWLSHGEGMYVQFR